MSPLMASHPCTTTLADVSLDALDSVYHACDVLTAAALSRACKQTHRAFKACRASWAARHRLVASLRSLLAAGSVQLALDVAAHATAPSAANASACLIISSQHSISSLVQQFIAAGAVLSSTAPVQVVLHHSRPSLPALQAAAYTLHIDALTAATLSASPAIVELLLVAGADPASSTAQPHLPVLIAAQSGSTACLSLLLKAGAPADHPYTCPTDISLHSPLAAAACQGHTDALQLLLDHGADIHAGHDAALVAAVLGQQLHAVQLLLAKGANPNTSSGLPLRLAAAIGSYPLVDALLARAYVHANADMPLRVAAAQGSFHIVGRLLSAGADAMAWGGQPLLSAAAGGHLDVVRLLLAAGADPLAMQGAALLAAANEGHISVVRLLLTSSSIPLALLRAALLAAVKHDQVQTATVLLRAVQQAVAAAAAAAVGPEPAAASSSGAVVAAVAAAGDRLCDVSAAGREHKDTCDEIWDVGQGSSSQLRSQKISITAICSARTGCGAAPVLTCTLSAAGKHRDAPCIRHQRRNQHQQQQQQRQPVQSAQDVAIHQLQQQELHGALATAIEHSAQSVLANLLAQAPLPACMLPQLLQQARAWSNPHAVKLLQCARNSRQGSSPWGRWLVAPLLGAAAGALLAVAGA